MKINLKFLSKIYSKNIKKSFSSIYTQHIEFNDDGTLSDKYYKAELLPNKITDSLILIDSIPISIPISISPAQSVQDLLKDETKNYIDYKKQLFPTEVLESAFVSNKDLKFNIPRKIYKSFLEKGMLGNAIKINHKNIELTVIGTMYERINILNLYKILNLIKPDMILMQLRPDRLLSNIDKYYNKESFIKKLIRDPSEIQPSLAIKEEVRRSLVNKGFIIDSKKLASNESLNNDNNNNNYKDIDMNQSERLSSHAISLISLWGEQKGTKILLSDLPEAVLLEKLANGLTLMQIRQIFEEVFIQYPKNPDWEPNTSLGTAINLYPDLFIHHSDAFLAQTINSLAELNINENKDKDKDNIPMMKAIAFVGYGQTESLPLYLNYDLDRNSLQKTLTIPTRHKTLIQGEDSLEILAEKWALLSIITNGVQVKDNKNLINSLISKYARDDMIKTGFNSENHLVNRTKHLYEQLIETKTEHALILIGQGYEDKKKGFMKKIFNDPLLNSQLL